MFKSLQEDIEAVPVSERPRKLRPSRVSVRAKATCGGLASVESSEAEQSRAVECVALPRSNRTLCHF